MPPRKVLDQTTFDTLTTALSSKNYKERRDAVNQLAKYRDSRARDVLIRALKDRTVTVRRRVVAALSKYKDPALIPHILVLLKDKTCRSHRLINKTVLEFGLEAEPYLLEALDSPIRQVRCAMAQLLAEIGSKRAFEPLLALVNPQSHEDSVFIIYALEKLGDPRVIDPLLVLLQDEQANAEVRRSAAVALIGFEDARITGAYFALLDHELPLLRTAGYRCLADRKLPADSLVPLLFKGIEDPNPQVMYMAFRGLEHYADDPRVVERMLDLMAQPGTDLWQPLGVLGYSHDPHVYEVLIGLLSDPEVKVRRPAVGAVIQMRNPRSVDALIGLLNDPDAQIRRNAWDALHWMNDPRGLAALEAQQAEPVGAPG